MISEKLIETDKTILLLGKAGAGKSKFSKMLAYQLLEKFDEYNIYPIHIKLSSYCYKKLDKDGNEVHKIQNLQKILASKRIN